MEERNMDLSCLPGPLLAWFYENKRSMPWRQDKDPYHIWLSEVMLQQTRVEAVKGYYVRFLEKYPTIEALAQAEDEPLAKLWEGLGYYSRMRNLKKAARVICREFGGQFPQSYEDVRKLPGVGDYTAGAICSIAFDQKTPAVDGNVLRVFSRLTNDATPIDSPGMKKKTAQFLQSIYPEQAGDFTQALMELGATLCGPNRKPDCQSCPCAGFCAACAHNTAQELPVKSPKKSRREEDLTVFLLYCDGCYALEKREKNGLLAGMWQFPNGQGHLTSQHAVEHLTQRGCSVKQILRQTEKKHIFTHIQWNMRGFYICLEEKSDSFQWYCQEEIEQKISLPTAFRQFWAERDVFFRSGC